MSDTIDLDRFRQLAESYGGDIGKWPEPVRLSARALAERIEAKAILDEAIGFDRLLDAWTVPAMPVDSARRVGGTAVGPHMLRRLKLWWAGVGLAAALSGMAAGSIATSVLMQQPQAYTTTIFGDVDDGDN